MVDLTLKLSNSKLSTLYNIMGKIIQFQWFKLCNVKLSYTIWNYWNIESKLIQKNYLSKSDQRRSYKRTETPFKFIILLDLSIENIYKHPQQHQKQTEMASIMNKQKSSKTIRNVKVFLSKMKELRSFQNLTKLAESIDSIFAVQSWKTFWNKGIFTS